MANEALLIHKQTKVQIDGILAKPPQALLITGEPGTGKDSLAELIASKLLDIPVEKLNLYPYYFLLTKAQSKSEISIEAVRGLIKSLSLKAASLSDRAINRVVHISGAQWLSTEAQNALLKIIEEPPPGTVFVLTAISVTAILPTIASRSQLLAALPIKYDDALAYFSNTHKDMSISSAWSLSQGGAGLISAILNEETGHPLKQSVELAKTFLKKTPYDRLVMLDGMSSDKHALVTFFDGLSRVLKELHRSTLNLPKNHQAQKILSARRLVNSAQQSLDKNTSVRLIILNFVLHLPI
jgi:hypothetical protein